LLLPTAAPRSRRSTPWRNSDIVRKWKSATGSLSSAFLWKKNDLTSALEICQSFGGSLVERSAGEAVEAYSSAYALDEGGINIPAHIVNEDFSDEYLEGGAFSGEVHI